jgi:hypothetical protein
VLTVAALVLAGCAGDMRYQVGREAQVAALESVLVVGESTERELRAELGPPDGVGRYLSPVSEVPRTMWTYHYEVGSRQQVERTMLFVFLKDRRYDGYLWYGSQLRGDR